MWYDTNLLNVVKEQDMTVKELAEAVGVHRGTIYHLISQGKGSIKLLLKISYVLDYPVTDIFDLNDELKQELEDQLWSEESDENEKVRAD